MQALTEQEAEELYRGSESAHDFDHVLRVARLGQRIAKAEGADVEVVRLAALLHDVPVAEARSDHHRAAAEHARRLLTLRGVDPARVENVAHCIEAHRFRDRSVQPLTLEARVLYDADKLDSIGAVGVLRAAAYAASHGHRLWLQPLERIRHSPAPQGADYTPSHEYVFKLSLLLETLHTSTARAIGRQRHQHMADFFDALDQELSADPEHGYDVEGEAPSRWNREPE